MKKQSKKVEEQEPVVKEEEIDYVPVEEPEPEPITYSDKPLEAIEKDRADFLRVYRLQNTFKWVISLVCIAAVVVGCIVVPNVIKDNDNLKTGLMLGIVLGALALTILYSVLTKRSMNKRMKKYFTSYYRNVNEFAFNQEGFENVVLQEPGKIDIELFRDTNLYKDLVSVGSRGLTEFDYRGIPMRIVDCAGNIRENKRIRPVFVGKMIHCACSYTDSQTIVIYFKGNDRALPPTNVGELKVREDNNKFIIYANNDKYNKVINANVLKLLKGIEMNKVLVDLAISMHDGKLFCCFGYDDPLMVLPLQNQFDPKPNEQFKKDLGKVIKVVEALNK